MVVALGHSHGLVTGDVVDLLDRDAEVQQPNSASPELMGDQIPRVLSYSSSDDSQDLSLLIIRQTGPGGHDPGQVVGH